MKTFHELSFSEQRRIRDLIDAALAETQTPEAGPITSPAPAPAGTTVADVLGRYRYPDPAWLNPEQADLAAADLTRHLARRGVELRGAQWLGGREYYGWLTHVFLRLPLPAGASPDRPVSLDFIDLAPDSVDNLFWTVNAFVRQLMGLRRTPATALLTPEAQAKLVAGYLPAWQAAFLSATVEELRPVAVHDLRDGSGSWLDFRVAYTVRFEDRSVQTFEGTGRALLRRQGLRWGLEELSFPGFGVG